MRTIPSLPDGVRIAFLIAMSVVALSCGRATRAQRAAIAPHPNGYELEIGKDVFQHYCAGCHGETGAGDGFNAFNLDPHPRDLGDAKFQKTKSDTDLADAIRRGGAGVGLTSLMPPWGHTLDDRHVNAVVLYVRSLRRNS